jgi:molecular chaperone GrpE
MIQKEPEETAAQPEAENIEALTKALAETTEKAEANLAGWQRAQADFINYKRRTEAEKEDAAKLANASLILSLLPVLDDLEQAFASMPANPRDSKWVDGIKAIERKLRVTLEAQGLSPIKALGEPFDPRFHEAATLGKGQEGIVIEELQKGYKLHDKVLRPAKVVVGSGDKEKEE